MVNNYKVQEAMKKPTWVADSPYGQPSEMVYRLLSTPMDYSTFATTAQLTEDQNITNDINIEYRKFLEILKLLASRSPFQSIIISTAGLAAT